MVAELSRLRLNAIYQYTYSLIHSIVEINDFNCKIFYLILYNRPMVGTNHHLGPVSSHRIWPLNLVLPLHRTCLSTRILQMSPEFPAGIQSNGSTCLLGHKSHRIIRGDEGFLNFFPYSPPGSPTTVHHLKSRWKWHKNQVHPNPTV